MTTNATALIDLMLAAMLTGSTAERINPGIRHREKTFDTVAKSYPAAIIQCLNEDYESDEQHTIGTFQVDIIVSSGQPQLIQEKARTTVKQVVREFHRTAGITDRMEVENINYQPGTDSNNKIVHKATVLMTLRYEEDYL